MKKAQYLILALLFGALLTQGFQCTSPEMTTARVASKNKDFDKAILNYEKELQKNPNNVEAMCELAEIYSLQSEKEPAKLNESVKLLTKARITPPQPNSKVNLNNYENTFYNVWINLYNQGTGIIQAMSKAEPHSAEMNSLGNQAVETFNNAVVLYPDNPDNYAMLGTVYAAMKENKKAVENFAMYNTKLQREIDFFKSKGLTIGQTPEEMMAILGKPQRIYPFLELLRNSKDTITLYQYSIKESKEPLMIFTKHNSKINRTGIMGWRFSESYNPFSFDITPNFELARISFEEKKYDKALDYINEIKKLDPTNPFANQFMVQIYDAQGNPDLAINAIQKLTVEQPNNPNFKAQYGDILLKNKRYDEAIAQYEAALKIKPDFLEIKKVLGSAYKNKAVEIQTFELEKYAKDNKYQINESLYTPYLTKSQKTFEEFTSTPQTKDDYEVLIELADIYASMKNDAKFKQTLDRLILLKDEIPAENKLYYYSRMVKLLDKSGNAEQLQIYMEELNNIK